MRKGVIYLKKIRMGLTTQIFLGLLLGACFGYFLPEVGSQLKPLGDAFIRMIKMIVVPLIFSTLIVGISKNSVVSAARRLSGLKWQAVWHSLSGWLW